MTVEDKGFWLPRQALQELVAKAARGPRHNPQVTPGDAPADGGTYGIGPSLLGGGQVMPQEVRDALAAEGMDQNVPLGPGRPIPPAFGYGAAPRVFDYPTGVNVAQRPRASMAAMSFDTLRAIIDAYDVARLCIRRRKADIRKLDWSIVPAKGVYDDVTDLIPQAERFFARPDGETPFDAWQDALLDDTLRYDAPTLYRWRNRAGKITLADDGTGFFNVDGTNIAVLVDEHGLRPHPVQDPDTGQWLTPPAFVEWIKGFPGMWFTVDDLIYNPYNKVTGSPYGVPPIEDVLLAVNTDVRLQWAFLQFFTEGSIPRQFMQAPPDISSPDQLKTWQEYWDALLRGDQTILHQIIWIPAGAQPKDAKDLKWDTDFAEFLLTKTCAAFGMTPQAIGYTMKVNRSTSETQRKEEDDSTTEPTVRFLEGIYDRILQEDLGLPLHFAFALQLDREDKLTEAQAANFDIRNGVMSPDERRLMLGLPVDTSNPVPRMVFFANNAIPLSSLNIDADPATATTAATADQAGRLLGGPAPTDGAALTGKPQEKPDFDAESEVPASELVALPRDRIPGAGPMPEGADYTMGPVGKDGLDGLIPAVSNARGPGLYPDGARRPKKAKHKELAKGGPIAAGLAVIAEDTGRVLMLQRANDPDDPAAGTWEVPGGCLEPGEAPFEAAAREWSEETGAVLPSGTARGTWTSPDGVYQGFVWLIPHETDVAVNTDHEDRHVLNPDDPDGDGIEVVAWWDPNHLPALPALRPAARSTDWSVLRAATGPGPQAVVVKAAKRTKEEVGYRAADGAERCGTCGHMNPDGSCDLVEGQVQSDMVCGLWAAAVVAKSSDPAVRAELRRWRTASLNRIRAGRLPKLDFASDVLPDPLRAELAKALEQARTPSAVAETFASVL